MEFVKLKNNICATDEFTATSTNIGLKKKKDDLGIIFCNKLCNTAAVYTKNKIKGAPLYINKQHLKNGVAQAIIINSGIANVSTGKKGIEDAKLMCKLCADELKIKQKNTLVASTGIIGKYLPMNKIKKGLYGTKTKLNKKSKIAEAILTTDIIQKEMAIKVDNFTIGAICKGSGMIHPNMATMLCFITTNANINSKELKQYLANAVDESFNMISVDGQTSTSDMAIIMANPILEVDKNKFQNALNFVCKELAKKIAADGEGATKLIEVKVKNAKTKNNAKKIAKAIISSNLVKTAIFGNDFNWGRIMCAIGNSKSNIKEEKINIFIQNKLIVKNGIEFNNAKKEKISILLKKDKVNILIDLKIGKNNATAWGCDMGYDYIKINAQYHT